MDSNMFQRTLIISPHCDDETIGCGGLISKLGSEYMDLRIVIVATHLDTYNYNVGRVVENEERIAETRRALKKLAFGASVYQLEGFMDGRLDQADRRSLVTQLDSHIREFKPTAVLFPYSSHHQDHQAVYQASVSALRPTVDTNFIKLKAMYEYPYVNSWSMGLNLNSKLYVPLSEENIWRKEQALREYKSQLVRDPRDILDVSSILTLAKTRGIEIGQEYAEAFYPMTIVAD